jgi:hypothetical protein
VRLAGALLFGNPVRVGYRGRRQIRHEHPPPAGVGLHCKTIFAAHDLKTILNEL